MTLNKKELEKYSKYRVIIDPKFNNNIIKPEYDFIYLSEMLDDKPDNYDFPYECYEILHEVFNGWDEDNVICFYSKGPGSLSINAELAKRYNPLYLETEE